MTSLLNPTAELIEKNLEVKSYIYQQITDFDPFVTPQTMVTVVARDPKKLALQYETEGKDINPDNLKKLHRIAIILTEGETKMEAEGVSENIYQAIHAAKSNLLQKLVAIHDSVISQQDRIIEINHFLQNRNLH